MAEVPIVGQQPKRQVQLIYPDHDSRGPDQMRVKSPDGIGHVKVENLLRRGIHALEAGYEFPSLACNNHVARGMASWVTDVTILEYDNDDERKMLCIDIFGVAPFRDFVVSLCYRALDGVQRYLLAQAVVARLAMTDLPENERIGGRIVT